MHPEYEDVTSRIKESPTFYMMDGYPRYGDFHPKMLGIYDQYALLVEIACQDCFKKFNVAMGWSDYTYIFRRAQPRSLKEIAENFHYGDPPRHGCVGDTMNCIDLQVLEAWEQAPLTTNKGEGLSWTDRWHRVPECEVQLENLDDYRNRYGV